MATEPFIGELRIFACTFAPFQWNMCNGQLISIAQNTALFSILGTNFGGNGTTTFGLPNLQARTIVGAGDGPGLTPRDVGEVGGEYTVTLNSTQMPSHNHNMQGKSAGGQENPQGNIFGIAGTQLPPPNFYANAIGNKQLMNANALPIAGSGQPHNNVMPNLVMNYCISMQGVFPQRN